MAAKSNSLGLTNYLRNCRKILCELVDSVKTLSELKSVQIRFILGNESADIDSIVSSLSYSYFLDWKKKKDSSTQACNYIPVLNLRREEFILRKEAVHLFQTVNVDYRDFLFLDDTFGRDATSLDSLMKTCQLHRAFEFILVDHNQLSPSQQGLSSCVCEIIDHHHNENLFDTTKVPQLIQTVGSCSTLIVSKILAQELGGAFLQEDSGLIAELVMAAILVDTSNFSATLAKGTPLDSRIIKTVTSFITGKTVNSEYVQMLYTSLFQAKHDIGDSTLSQLLIKDYKEGIVGDYKFGISSIGGISGVDFVKRDPEYKDMASFRESKQLFVLVIMNSFSDADGNFFRDIILYGPSMETNRSLSNFLQQYASPSLELEPIHMDAQVLVFHQKNISSTRKQVMPMLIRYLGSLDRKD